MKLPEELKTVAKTAVHEIIHTEKSAIICVESALQEAKSLIVRRCAQIAQYYADAAPSETFMVSKKRNSECISEAILREFGVEEK